MEVCKNCGREIMEGVIQGKKYWYHCIDFGDCEAEPITKDVWVLIRSQLLPPLQEGGIRDDA